MLSPRWLVVMPALLLAVGCGGGSAAPRAAETKAASPSPVAPVSPSPAAAPSGTPVSAVKAGPVERIAETDEFGYVVRVSSSPLEVEVDRVDMLTGAAAETAAAAHGDELDTDYYLVNDSTRLRRYPVAADAVVWGSIRMNRQGPEHVRMTLAEWLDFVDSEAGRQTLFHFDTEAGRVVAIEEQYLP